MERYSTRKEKQAGQEQSLNVLLGGLQVSVRGVNV